MSVGTTDSRACTVSASMKPMPGISQPDSRAADRENLSPRPRPPVATAGRTHCASGPVVGLSAGCSAAGGVAGVLGRRGR